MPQPVAVRDKSHPDGNGPSNAGPALPGSPRLRLRRALTLLLVTLLLPGSAQRLVGNRPLGRLVQRVWLGQVGVVAVLLLLWLPARSFVLWLVTSTVVLTGTALLCFGWAVLMPVLLVDAWRLGRPQLLPVRVRRRLAAATVVLALLSGYGGLAAGSRAWTAADAIGSVFSGTRVSAATGGRFNVLLLGGDSGPDRIGTRPDSITLASIDADTGRTVLFSLPRNLENVPFPAGTAAARALPHGYSCGDPCLLNALYTWGIEHAGLFPGATDPGAEAMKQAVQGISGLTVNYYVIVDLAGFASLIDALGGITVTVRTPVPIGGGTSRVSGYLSPGTRRLDGYHALWFARSRHGADDYDRMARQRCVMDAMLRQLDPEAVLANFEQVAAAGRRILRTDVPAGQLATFVDLAVKAKRQSVSSVQFVPPLINPARPDYRVIRSRIAAAVQASRSGAVVASPASAGTRSTGTARASSAPHPAAPHVTAPPGGPTVTAVHAEDDLSSVCSPA